MVAVVRLLDILVRRFVLAQQPQVIHPQPAHAQHNDRCVDDQADHHQPIGVILQVAAEPVLKVPALGHDGHHRRCQHRDRQQVGHREEQHEMPVVTPPHHCSPTLSLGRFLTAFLGRNRVELTVADPGAEMVPLVHAPIRLAAVRAARRPSGGGAPECRQLVGGELSHAR